MGWVWTMPVPGKNDSAGIKEHMRVQPKPPPGKKPNFHYGPIGSMYAYWRPGQEPGKYSYIPDPFDIPKEDETNLQCMYRISGHRFFPQSIMLFCLLTVVAMMVIFGQSTGSKLRGWEHVGPTYPPPPHVNLEQKKHGLGTRDEKIKVSDEGPKGAPTDVISAAASSRSSVLWDGSAFYNENASNVCNLSSATHSTLPPTSGYTLYSMIGSHLTDLVDAKGYVAHRWFHQLPGLSHPALLENGNLLRLARPLDSDTRVRIEELDWTGASKHACLYGDETYSSHSDVVKLPSGNFLLLASKKVDLQVCVANGLDVNGPMYESMRQSLSGHCIVDGLVEVTMVDWTVECQTAWDWWHDEHWIQDKFPEKKSYGSVPKSLEKIDLNYITDGAPLQKTLGLDGLHFDSRRQQILVTSDVKGELYVIDRTTGFIVFRWGSAQAYQNAAAGTFSSLPAHGPSVTPAGDLLWFESGAVQLSPERDADGSFRRKEDHFGPPSTAWSCMQDDWSECSEGGTAQRLPNGNTLMTCGAGLLPSSHSSGWEMREVDKACHVVWKHANPYDQLDMWATHKMFMSFHPKNHTKILGATRYAPSFGGLKGKSVWTSRDVAACLMATVDAIKAQTL